MFNKSKAIESPSTAIRPEVAASRKSSHTFVPQKLIPQSPTIEQIVRLKEAGLIEEDEARRLLAVHHGIGEAPAQPHRNVIDTDD